MSKKQIKFNSKLKESEVKNGDVYICKVEVENMPFDPIMPGDKCIVESIVWIKGKNESMPMIRFKYGTCTWVAPGIPDCFEKQK